MASNPTSAKVPHPNSSLFLPHIYISNPFSFYPVGIPVFGPSALAARMEGSKAFSKDFMARHNIPTASYRTFPSSQVKDAIEYVRTCGHKVVLKASGLAAGKGVLIPETVEEAVKGLEEIMVAHAFGSAGEFFSSPFLWIHQSLLDRMQDTELWNILC